MAQRTRVLAAMAAALPLVLAAGYSGSTTLSEASAVQAGPGGVPAPRTSPPKPGRPPRADRPRGGQ